MQSARAHHAQPPLPFAAATLNARSKPVVLRTLGITKSYRYGVPGCGGSARAIANVDLLVAGGELVGVVGPPGSGKSTLLLCCAGMLRPDRGGVSWPGAAGATRSSLVGIAFVPQQPAMAPFFTVREVIDRYRVGRACSPIAECSVAHRLLASIGLAGRERTRVAELGVAERWRLVLLVAVLGQPWLLIADGIDADDSITHSGAVARLTRLFCDRGGAALVSARDEICLPGAVDRVLALRDGRLASGDADLASAPLSRSRPVLGATPREPSCSVDRMVAAT